MLLALLVFPFLCLAQLSQRWPAPLVFGVPAALSLATYLVYWRDKLRAQREMWRIPEATLHWLALLGGWPGAFLAQRILRHKNRKMSFQVTFWLTVFLHQLAAFDALQKWKWLHTLLDFTFRPIRS